MKVKIIRTGGNYATDLKEVEGGFEILMFFADIINDLTYKLLKHGFSMGQIHAIIGTGLHYAEEKFKADGEDGNGYPRK